MPFIIQHGGNAQTSGFAAFLIGRNQQNRANRALEMQQQAMLGQSLGQGITEAGRAIGAGLQQRNAQQNALERIELYGEQQAERQQQGILQRDAMQRLAQDQKIQSLMPQSQARYYTNSQRISQLQADVSLSDDERMRMIEPFAMENQLILDQGPFRETPTIDQVMESGQIRYMPEAGVIFSPKGQYDVRRAAPPSTDQISAEKWLDMVNQASMSFQLENAELTADQAFELGRAKVDALLGQFKQQVGGQRRQESLPPPVSGVQQQRQEGAQQQQLFDAQKVREQMMEQAGEGEAFEERRTNLERAFYDSVGEMQRLVEFARDNGKSGTAPSTWDSLMQRQGVQAARAFLQTLDVIGDGLTAQMKIDLIPIVELALKLHHLSDYQPVEDLPDIIGGR